ncbi:MAG TPA: carbohydrate ABC transporter permease [Acidimicrobiales bacterium]|nr:carbohydrate ABC transporter permease [Acidimicrobiales bacterium]
MALQPVTHPAGGLSVPAVGARQTKVRGRVVTRRRLVDLTAAAILSCLAFVGIFPYLYMLETALKSNSQFNSNEATPTWPLHFSNFVTAWGDVAPYLLASVIVAACTMIGCLALGSITGFVLARYHFPGRNLFFGLIALLLMVPNIASLIPLFVLMRDLHLLNTYPDLIIPQLTTQTVFAVVLMKTYIEQLPNELFDAAHIDGASSARTYWSITLPLARPIIGTVALFSVISVWSEYFWPELTIVTNSLRTVPVGVQFFQGELTTAYGPLFAGYIIASVPLLVLFVVLAKNFLAGIQGGLAVDR